MVINVNPILQDCLQALILLALLSVFLFSIIATAGLARNKSNLAVAAIYRIAYNWCVA
jgi:hypothetical protein